MATSLPETDKIKLAVVVGGHPYDVPAFRDLFYDIPDVDPYIQDLDNWAVSGVFDQYDVFLFFNMHSDGIYSVRGGMEQTIHDAMNRLGETEQGIFVLHHAILAFPDVEVWSNICNMDNRILSLPGHAFKSRADIKHEIVNPDHPITAGLEPFTLNTEGFLIDDARKGSEVLLRTDCPDSVKTLAWTHQHKKARMLGYVIGHDADDWGDPGFQTVLARGIRWCANKL